MPRSCQVPKHARLRTHDTSENQPRETHLACFTRSHARTPDTFRSALPFPDLDPAGFLPFAIDHAGSPRRSPGIAVPDGALKIPSRRRGICRRIRHLQRVFDLEGNCAVNSWLNAVFMIFFLCCRLAELGVATCFSLCIGSRFIYAFNYLF